MFDSLLTRERFVARAGSGAACCLCRGSARMNNLSLVHATGRGVNDVPARALSLELMWRSPSDNTAKPPGASLCLFAAESPAHMHPKDQ
jgi:hypothetical protein